MDSTDYFEQYMLHYVINQACLEDQEGVKNGTRQEVRTEEMIIMERAFLFLCSHGSES